MTTDDRVWNEPFGYFADLKKQFDDYAASRKGNAMTTDLKALADTMKDAQTVCLRQGYTPEAESFAKAEAILRTLADADPKMPVVAVLDQHDNELMHPGFLLPESEAKMTKLIRQSDAQAAILAATERAEKAEALLREAEKDAARYRWLRGTDSYSAWKRLGHYAAASLDAVIDQHLGAAK